MVVSMSRQACGTQSAPPSSAAARSIGSQGAELARVSGAPGLPARRCSSPPELRNTVHQLTRSTRGVLVDQNLEPCGRALSRGHMIEQFQLAVGFQQAGVRADAVYPDAVQRLGSSDQRVGHRSRGQFDHQVVDRIAVAALDHVEREDVGAHRAERDRQRPKAARPVGQLDTQ